MFFFFLCSICCCLVFSCFFINLTFDNIVGSGLARAWRLAAATCANFSDARVLRDEESASKSSLNEV